MKEFFKYVLATIAGIIAISIIGFFLFFMIIGALISSADKQVSVVNNSMLTLNLERQVLDRAPNDPFEDLEMPGFLSQAKTIGLDDITKSLEKAVHDERIKGVYLRLSIINAGMATVEEIRNSLLTFKDSCNKPIYVYGNKFILDQKAYYLATVADKIVIHPEVAIDFRGLGGEMMFYKNALDKIGVEMQIVRGPNNKYKAAREPFMLDKMSEENREQSLKYLGSLWNHMLKGISEKRKIPIEQLNLLADEVQTFNKGKKAVESGLVDEVKYMDEVLGDLRKITGAKGKNIPLINASKYADIPVKGKTKKFSRNKIAVIYASGQIGMPMGGEGIDGDKLSREIMKVRKDSSYKAIVLRVNSPGGTIFDSETIWREVKLASEEKTLVVSFGDVAASGGYYIACPADKIVAFPNTITGSIGIFGQVPNFGELLNEKLGITTDVVKTNKNSDLLTLTRPMTEYERQLLNSSITAGYNTFIAHVAEGRGMTTEQVDEIAQGRVWSGENALEIGLIDEFGGLKEAINLAAEIEGLEAYRTVSLPVLEDPFQELFKIGTENARTHFLKKELGENYRYYQHLKQLSQMNGVYARMPYDISIN